MTQTPIAKSLQDFFASNRRGAARVNVCNATIRIDGETCPVNDFSRTGFEAKLPKHLLSVGTRASGVLSFKAIGWDVEQQIDFEVVRVTAKGNAGARYQFKGGKHWKTEGPTSGVASGPAVGAPAGTSAGAAS